MGGSSGSSFSGKDLDALLERARELRDASADDAEINTFLQDLLIDLNNRDTDMVDARLDEIESALDDRIAFERFLFGGSVAKHTYVDGLSDVDALAIMDAGEMGHSQPDEVLASLLSTLRQRLSAGSLLSIEAGNMAVTIRYRSGPEIQVLPALEVDGHLSVPSSDSSTWTPIDPRAFASTLSATNQRYGGAVIPAIKLTKALLANNLGDDAPSGYHIEALAIAAFRDYSGRRTPSVMVRHLVSSASRHVLHRLRDTTGQSRYVDEYLGGPNSAGRRSLARDLSRLARRLVRRSISDWREMFE